MPYQEPDQTDPMMLVGTEVPTHGDTSRDTIAVLAEEYARLGFDEQALMQLFRNPFYAGAHRAYQALGEEAVCNIVREQLEFWGRARVRVVDAPPRATGEPVVWHGPPACGTMSAKDERKGEADG